MSHATLDTIVRVAQVVIVWSLMLFAVWWTRASWRKRKRRTRLLAQVPPDAISERLKPVDAAPVRFPRRP